MKDLKSRLILWRICVGFGRSFRPSFLPSPEEELKILSEDLPFITKEFNGQKSKGKLNPVDNPSGQHQRLRQIDYL